MTPVEQIIEHARAASHRARHPGSDGWRHGSLHDVVLAHGRIFEPSPLPANVYPALPGHASKAAAINSRRSPATCTHGPKTWPRIGRDWLRNTAWAVIG